MEKHSIISVKSLAVGYGKNIVLSDINFSLNAGSLSVLIGANGSGKSTLLRSISGISAPIRGEIEICGKNIETFRRRELAKTMAVVFTDRNGGGALTVSECVALGRHPHTGPFGRLDSEDKDIIGKAIADVGLEHKSSSYLGSLSDGERQKAMIARALAQQTPLIVLDEPTAFLDVAGRLEIMQLLHRLAANGNTILLSSHDIASAIAVADSLLVIDSLQRTVISDNKDKIIASGAMDKAFPEANLRFDVERGDFIALQSYK